MKKAGRKRPGGKVVVMANSTLKAEKIKAYVRGRWRVVGVLRHGNGKPVFEQRINPRNILRIRGAAGVDVNYEPPLPEGSLIRHVVAGAVYEIPLSVLLNHPKARRERIGSLHPERVYLSYRYWHHADDKQLALFG